SPAIPRKTSLDAYLRPNPAYQPPARSCREGVIAVTLQPSGTSDIAYYAPQVTVHFLGRPTLGTALGLCSSGHRTEATWRNQGRWSHQPPPFLRCPSLASSVHDI